MYLASDGEQMIVRTTWGKLLNDLRRAGTVK